MRAVGLSLLLFSSSALAQTASPVPTSMPEDGAPPAASPPKSDGFDADDARKQLGAVDYKDCGKGGPAKILVTFSTDGTVERVVLAEGSWQPEVAICVTRRFSEVRVAAFTGASHTVKYAVQLEGGPAPAATYATPAAAPTYNPYMGPRPEVIDANDNGPPPGYHEEGRRRTGPLISGSIIAGMGLLFTTLALSEDRRSDRELYQLLAIVHIAVGVPLFLVGLSSKRVYVANNVSLAPAVFRGGGGASLAFTF